METGWGGRATLWWRNLRTTTSAKDQRLTSVVTSHVDRTHLTSVFFLPKTHNPQCNHEKNIRQTSVEAHFANHLTSTSQNCQDYQKQGKSENML